MFYSWLTQMRGFVPEFWLTEQMLHMLTWDESSLDQLSAHSLLVFALARPKIGTVLVSGTEAGKREYSTARGRWEDNESGFGERYHSVQSSKLFVPWLIKIQEALRVKLFNQLCIYDAPLSLWYLCSSALESQDLSLNILPCHYSSILFLSSISLCH